MDFHDLLPPSNSSILLTIAVLLTFISYLFQTQTQRKAFRKYFFDWLPSMDRGRRTSSSDTPPRSLTPEKNGSTDNNASPYKDIFPPSTRENLPIWSQSYVSIGKSLLGLRSRSDSSNEVNKDLKSDMVIPFEADYRTCDPSLHTPTGITLKEVKGLGDFPDYARLSGVPLPEPYLDFRAERAIARPYRPFRWAYHQTMSLTRLEPNWWLELEHTYVERIAQRKALFEKHGKLVLNYLPGSELGCKEIMEHALQFLCARYPQHFSLTYHHSTRKGRGYVFKNNLLKNETFIGGGGNDDDLQQQHPLHVLLNNVPEDFAIMIRNPEDGMYYFRAGLLCSSLGWNVDTKLGLQLKDIHAPIPDYKAKMEFSMDRFFSKLPTDRPIQRGSWGLEIDQPLFMPPGDPHETYRTTQLPDLPLSRCHLRVDWQTLRRLPLSGAIVFNFKALFTPVEDFRDEAYVPALLLKNLDEGKREIMEYKNTWHVEHVVKPKLEEWSREQVEKGLVPEGWEVETLEESPWFPGWEEKWRRQQGF